MLDVRQRRAASCVERRRTKIDVQEGRLESVAKVKRGRVAVRDFSFNIACEWCLSLRGRHPRETELRRNRLKSTFPHNNKPSAGLRTQVYDV
jgi:hypothetical protein